MYLCQLKVTGTSKHSCQVTRFCDTSNRKATVVLGSIRVFKFRIVLPYPIIYTLRLLNSQRDRRQKLASSPLFSSPLHGHGPLNIQKWRHEHERTRRQQGRQLPQCHSSPLHPSKDIWQKRKKIVSRSKSSKCDLISANIVEAPLPQSPPSFFSLPIK